MKIGFIGGGNMAEAIILGLIKKKFDSKNIIISEIDKKRLDYMEDKLNIKKAKSNFFKEVNVIILAVKPQLLYELLENIKDNIKEKHLIISIVAGVKLDTICKKLSTGNVIRAMPNMASSICEGVTSLYRNEDFLSNDQVLIVENIFSAIGYFLWIKESHFDVIGALTGSGPAYVYRFIEALSDGAVSLGLPRELAIDLIIKTILGSTKILIESNQTPRNLSDKVTSPGGTTILALNAMEKNGFSISIHKGLKKAYLRSIELSKSNEKIN